MIIEFFVISFIILNIDVICFGVLNGSVIINVSGGVGGFVYVWNGNS